MGSDLPKADQLVRVTARICLRFVESDSAISPPQLPSPPLVPCSSRGLWSSPPQVSIRLDGENKAVEYNAVGAMTDAVRVVFRGPRVHDLFTRDWHKLALSIQAQNVSLYIDCALVQTLPIEERENIDIQGKTVIGKRLYDSVPIDVSTGGPSTAQVLGSPGRSLRSQVLLMSPTPACIIYQAITSHCLRREDPDSENCHITITHSFTHSFNYLDT